MAILARIQHSLAIYRHFLHGVPYYLARHYWWAYLWRPAIWFFDHQAIISLILFGQYKKLMRATLALLDNKPGHNFLQLTCVYGGLTPLLYKKWLYEKCLNEQKLPKTVSNETVLRKNVFHKKVLPQIRSRQQSLEKMESGRFHIVDVSADQLHNTANKLPKPGPSLARMNSECLAYKDNAFTAVLIFFLLHEQPPDARRRTLSECLRVLSHNGRLICTEYAALPKKHLLYRCLPCRGLLTWLEPFLDGFWREDIVSVLNDLGTAMNKRVELVSGSHMFFKFYRVLVFKVIDVHAATAINAAE